MTGPYINDLGYEVPKNKILVIPIAINASTHFEEIVDPLKGKAKRDWFNPHAYYCLPLTIGNQYGFLIKSMRDFDIIWDGTTNDAKINFLNNDNQEKQHIKTGFKDGIITVQNNFSLKTPPNINLMTIQPPNLFIPGCIALTGVIECDNIRRDFTFNFKVTVPNISISVRKGDPLGAFIPIPRNFVDEFVLEKVENYFDESFIQKENEEARKLSVERTTVDLQKNHQSGRRYFKGIHTDETKYVNHQKNM
jgi:Family of unknown function (DUF6065)